MKNMQVSAAQGAAKPATGASLFQPLQQRSIHLRNRIAVSPMCQYSSQDGFADDWHLVHLGSRAVGGAGVVLTEAAAVTPEGRISPDDLGIWKDEHIPALERITHFVRMHGAVPGIQLAHAGRKASMAVSWKGGALVPPGQGGWTPLGPSGEPFAPSFPTPRSMTEAEIQSTVDAFRSAAARALTAGFQIAEIHAAHGYLIHEFLSPLINRRSDRWGGSFENRTRFAVEVIRATREVWPEELPLWIRISAIDWADGGWDVEQSVRLARLLAPLGVDLVDVSSGGGVSQQAIQVGPGYQVPFAAQIRREAGVATGAVGMIAAPDQADAIIRAGEADLVLLAREELRDPYWPLHAAHALGAETAWPRQYERARPR